MDREKPHIKVVILGNIDSGKTTLAGHLIYKCGVIDKRIFDRFEKKAKEMGKHLFKYAWIFNQLKSERERGLTIDISSWQFETNKKHIALIDGPGYKDFMKCMTTSISLANCALLLMPASSGEFEASISKFSLMHQQLLLACTIGIEHMVVVVNKMDTTNPPYSESRFDEIKTEVLVHLKTIAYQSQNVIFIPISAWLGDNLIESSDKMLWFKGWTVNNIESTRICRTLLDVLDHIVLSRPIDKPLRLCLQAKHKTKDAETVLIGLVESGILKLNMIIQFTPSNLCAQVKSIEMHYENLEEALTGDKVAFCIDGVNSEILRRGVVCSDAKNNPAQESSSFITQITIIHHPNRITKGYRCVLHCHMAQVTCEFAALLQKIHRKSGTVIEENPEFIRSNDTALVKITTLKPICVEKFIDYPSLGRFVVFDQGWLIAVGIVKHVEKMNPPPMTTANEN